MFVNFKKTNIRYLERKVPNRPKKVSDDLSCINRSNIPFLTYDKSNKHLGIVQKMISAKSNPIFIQRRYYSDIRSNDSSITHVTPTPTTSKSDNFDVVAFQKYYKMDMLTIGKLAGTIIFSCGLTILSTLIMEPILGDMFPPFYAFTCVGALFASFYHKANIFTGPQGDVKMKHVYYAYICFGIFLAPYMIPHMIPIWQVFIPHIFIATTTYLGGALAISRFIHKKSMLLKGAFIGSLLGGIVGVIGINAILSIGPILGLFDVVDAMMLIKSANICIDISLVALYNTFHAFIMILAFEKVKMYHKDNSVNVIMIITLLLLFLFYSVHL